MNIFQQVRIKKPKRNAFNLSYESKLSCQMGDLIPIFCQEVVPGDKFKVNTEMMLRMAPMIAPVMHRVNVYTHYFFVPNRLIWNEWKEFITGGEDGSSSPTPPYVKYAGSTDLLPYFSNGSLADYMGIPTRTAQIAAVNSPRISLLPFRAYQMIYNEYYRDQNLEDPVPIDLTSGDKTSLSTYQNLLTLRKRCWEKDYFTSALPWTQRGQEVRLPLTGDAQIEYNGNTGLFRSDDTISSTSSLQYDPESGESGRLNAKDAQDQLHRVSYDPNGSLTANLQNVTSATINELRRAVQLQKWLESNARGGSRYIEQIFSHFGVKSSDARLQRPEYLGGGKSPVVISEVLQTSASQSGEDASPQGNMAGRGISVGNTHEFSKYFEEHGFVIGIMSILPRTSYQQGLPRMFCRDNRFDYYWPEFAHLGEQPILNKEIYLANDKDNDVTFGYTPRYAEYKYMPGQVHGDFRDTLAFWHMGRIFNTRPYLNSSFVHADPTTRIFAVEDQSYDKIYVQLYHNFKAIRPMPKFGTPTL